MEGRYIFKSFLDKFSHFPTLLLIVGYPVYWIELYFLNKHTGVTSSLAIILLACFTFIYFIKLRKLYPVESAPNKSDESLTFFEKIFIVASSLICIGILFIVTYAHCMPVHMPQELDALIYHITLPRQHLILGSFQHIPWSMEDFF